MQITVGLNVASGHTSSPRKKSSITGCTTEVDFLITVELRLCCGHILLVWSQFSLLRSRLWGFLSTSD